MILDENNRDKAGEMTSSGLPAGFIVMPKRRQAPAIESAPIIKKEPV